MARHGGVSAGECSTHYWPFVRGIPRWSMDSPHKGAVLWKFHILFLVSLNIQLTLRLIEAPWHTWHHCTLQWRHNGHGSVSNHQPYDCLLNRLFRHRSKKTSKLRVTGLCVGNSPVPGEFPAQMSSNAENVSISWRHHESALKRSLPMAVLTHWPLGVVEIILRVSRAHTQQLSKAEFRPFIVTQYRIWYRWCYKKQTTNW